MTAAEIAAALGGARRCGQWWRCVCPVHGSRTGHSLTLALRYGDRGLVVHCHAGCAPRDVLAELRRMGLLAGRDDRACPTPLPDRNDRDADAAQRIAQARRLWDSGRDPCGTLVGTYLRSRGLGLPPEPVLRWAPRCWNRETRRELPAMLARVDDANGEFVAVHRTWLTPEGGKAKLKEPKMSLGPVGGGAVRLAPATETLLIGEGIETTISGMVATGLAGWAALSAPGLKALRLPSIVRAVVILADHDGNGAGQRAAATAARHWLAEGARVSIYISPREGEDANDLLLAAMAEARRAA
jgi:putative DNA primase/helicase